MTELGVTAVLREARLVRSATADPELAALETALLLESVFDVVLSDEQIARADLRDPAVVKSIMTIPSANL